jgi:hypothetical protein
VPVAKIKTTLSISFMLSMYILPAALLINRVVSLKSTDVSEVLTASFISAIALFIEEVSTSKTSVSFYKNARRDIPEACHLVIPL